MVPPPEYWEHLAGTAPSQLVQRLRELSDKRLTEFTPSALGPPESAARALLERVAADGWLTREQRRRCPNCDSGLDEDQAEEQLCPNCRQPYDEQGGVTTEIVYVRNLAPSRSVDWVILIHGMNTRGAWQEEFSWHLATTWGRSVPVAIYKYGIIRAGVLPARRRRQLQDGLRTKLAVLQGQARSHGFSGKPDVIAHSFGTWLLGHLIEAELKREPEDQLRFGRLILTGCILRSDFAWARLKNAGLVEDVLNHSASNDRIVQMARFAIRDSGCSGRSGFKDEQVVNRTAVGCGHSDLFSIEKCVSDGKFGQACTGSPGEIRHLDYFYRQYWRPFWTLPSQEFSQLPQ